MPSAFRRRPTDGGESAVSTGVRPLLLPGTKAWTGGLTFTSTGLRDWDRILAGIGQAPGTALWVQECGSLAGDMNDDLLRYWCSEAISQRQPLMIPIDSREEDLSKTLLQSCGWDDENVTNSACWVGCTNQDVTRLWRRLPRNLHHDKYKAYPTVVAPDSGNDDNMQSQGQLGVLQEENDVDEDETKEDDALQNAWQYRKDVQQERSGQTPVTTTRSKGEDVFCHSYDLHRSLQEQELDGYDKLSTPIVPWCTKGKEMSNCRRGCGFAYFRLLRDKITEAVAEHPNQVLRLLLWRPLLPVLRVTLPLLLSHIRHHGLPVVILLSVMATMSDNFDLIACRRHCDSAITVESFVSRTVYPPPPEFRLFDGLLHLHHTSVTLASGSGGSLAHVTAQRRPEAFLYGLKRERRKLHIELLHIPPEEYSAGGGGGSGGVRSSGGLGGGENTTSVSCGSGTRSQLDF